MVLSEGQIVGGRYRLVRPLGAGGMGSVWVAEHIAMGTMTALKIIAREWAAHPVALARFRREARAAAELRSPHVVQVLDYDVDPKVGPFIVMELLEGEDLGARLALEGTLTPAKLADVGTQIGKALARAHAAGVVHRDLKPENVFLVPDVDGSENVKLLDFGVAKIQQPQANDEFRTAAGVLVGTLSRMSPEQVQGHLVDHRADIWAFGLIAYQSLVGSPPLDDTSSPGQLMLEIAFRTLPIPSKASPIVPPGFDAWFEKATSLLPDDRFQDAMAAARDLATICLASPEPQRAWSLPASSRKALLELVPNPVLQLVPSIASDLIGTDPNGVSSAAPKPDVLDTSQEEEFYVMQGSIPTGPVLRTVLLRSVEAGRVTSETLVWCEAHPVWRPICEALAVGLGETTADDSRGPMLPDDAVDPRSWPDPSTASGHRTAEAQASALTMPPPRLWGGKS